MRRDEGFVVRPDDGQHRICLVCGEAAALPNALGGAWPHTPKLRAEAHTHSKLRAFLRKRFYPPPVLYALKDFLIKRLGSLLEHTT